MPESALVDLAAYCVAIGEAPTSASPVDDLLRERVQDHLSPGEVAQAYAAARTALPAPAGEPARRRLRSVARLYLDRQTPEEDRELVERLAQGDPPQGGFLSAVARAAEPRAREELRRRWFALEQEVWPVRVERARVRNVAAQRVGASSSADLLAGEHAVQPAPLADGFARAAIAPLDVAIRAATRGAFARARLDPQQPADGPRLYAATQSSTTTPTKALERVVALFQPRGGGRVPQIQGDDPRGPWSQLAHTGEGIPHVLLGELDGPAALRRSLGTLGRALRWTFLLERRGLEQLWSEPAFDSAAEVLFRRLLLSSEFHPVVKFRPGLDWADDLRLEEALAPRLVWAYLHLTTERTSPDAIPQQPAISEVIERATGRAATPDQAASALDLDPQGVAVLRGTVLAVLIEERLLTQFGRAWFTAPRAHAFLRDCWEAEPDETAETMASALNVGTIEGIPLLDRCRP